MPPWILTCSRQTGVDPKVPAPGSQRSAVILQVLAMSSRSWLSYSYQSRFHLTPLSYETLEYASGFASEQCPEGIVAISTNTLRWGPPGGATVRTLLGVSA